MVRPVVCELISIVIRHDSIQSVKVYIACSGKEMLGYTLFLYKNIVYKNIEAEICKVFRIFQEKSRS